jgi:hypothetical protein
VASGLGGLSTIESWLAALPALEKWLAIWPFLCVAVRWMMVSYQCDGSDPGIIPAFTHIAERWIDEDNTWTEFYENIPKARHQNWYILSS